MSMERIEERVDRLERLVEYFIEEIADFKKWVVRFLSEYKEHVDRQIREYKEETNRQIAEYKSEVNKQIRENNKRWGELANKMGTIVEDIIYPALRLVIERYFGCEVLRIAIRLTYRERAKGIYEEFDAVAECEDKVFLVEVKSTPREKHVEEFKAKAKRFVEYFPAFSGKRLILIMASLKFDEGYVDLLSQAGIYAMAFREWEYMDIINFEEVKDA